MNPSQLAAYFASPEFRALPRDKQRERMAALQADAEAQERQARDAEAAREAAEKPLRLRSALAKVEAGGSDLTPDEAAEYFRSPAFRGLSREEQHRKVNALAAVRGGR